MRLLVTKEGRGSQEYLIQCGRLGADQVIALGIYEQLKPENAQRLGDRFGRFLVTLAGAAHNFARWEFTGSMDRFRIESVVSHTRQVGRLPSRVCERHRTA